MMENRKKIGLLIIGVAIIILIIIIVLLLKKTSPTEVTTIPTDVNGNTLVDSGATLTPTSTPGDVYRNPQKYNVAKEEPYKLNSNDVAETAKLFAERLGSFSNQSDYGNVTDLKIFMTASMRDWADKYVADLKAQPYSGVYYGITTHTLTTKVLSYDDKGGKAKVEVITERQETNADKLGTAYSQKMTLDLVKSNNNWLVDNAVWAKK